MSLEFQQLDNILSNEYQISQLVPLLQKYTPEETMEYIYEGKLKDTFNLLMNNIWSLPLGDKYPHHLDHYENVIAKYVVEQQQDKLDYFRSIPTNPNLKVWLNNISL